MSLLDGSNLKWIFDPAPVSGAREGGLPSNLIFRPDLDSFVREVLQNSRDQRSGEQAVEVKFTFHNLIGEHKERFLHYIGWDELRPHVEGAADSGGVTIRPQLEEALEAIDNGKLLVLRIDDSGTKGLTGPEDDDPDDEDPGNFNALCRHTLVTSETGASRGGSFGVGKSVLWRFSLLSTILFSSRLADDPRPGFRFFGRSELPYHRTSKASSWRGPGWYGVGEETGLGSRAVSAWDHQAEDVARWIFLDRPAQLGTGTSILVVGFFEPGEEQAREPKEIASSVLSSASRWFWPSMSASPPQIQVSAQVYDNGTEVYYQKAAIDQEVNPFALAASEPQVEGPVSKPGDVVERTLPFTVPSRTVRGAKSGKVDASLKLRLRLAGTEDSPDLKNRIAMVRGSRMVVKYEPLQIPLSDQLYHATLYAGLARGESEADHALEHFLRAAEPPSHNDWIATTDRLRDEYSRGARTEFSRLNDKLRKAVADILEERPAETEQGPEKLAELFPLAGEGGGSTGSSKFRTDKLFAYLDNGVWHLSGRIRRPARATGDWEFTVAIWLDAETGRGKTMPVAKLEVDSGYVHPSGDGWRCRVDSSIRQVIFEGHTEHDPQSADGLDLYRTRARLEVNARKVDAQKENGQ